MEMSPKYVKYLIRFLYKFFVHVQYNDNLWEMARSPSNINRVFSKNGLIIIRKANNLKQKPFILSVGRKEARKMLLISKEANTAFHHALYSWSKILTTKAIATVCITLFENIGYLKWAKRREKSYSPWYMKIHDKFCCDYSDGATLKKNKI